MKPVILVVDDDRAMGELLSDVLGAHAFEVLVSQTGNDALATVAQRADIALVLLDMILPDTYGLQVLQQLQRTRPELPVVMLSGLGSESDVVVGLEMGADDYLAKPFSLLELIARVKALFRRQEAMGQNLLMDAGHLSCHGLSIDPLSREVKLRGETVDLTPREFDLLYYFARHPGEVFSRLALLEQVWGYQHEGYEHTVNTHINRLRSKIERDPAEPDIILTVWGKGYKFAPVTQEAVP